MQAIRRNSLTRVKVRTELVQGQSYSVVLLSKFSCEEVELVGEGFVCRDKTFLLITADVPCGVYDLIIEDYQIPLRIK